jgi:uncharacterized protein YggE
LTTETPRITVTGEATVTRKPDVAYITLYLRSEGILLEDAVKEAAGTLDRIKSQLREAYAEIKDIQVKDVHIGEAKPSPGLLADKRNPGRPEVITGILVVVPAKQDLAVAIVDTACRMGCVMGNPANHFAVAGASSTILYALAKPDDAEQEALSRAIANAKEKASMMARKLERKVGPVHQMNMMVPFVAEDMMMKNRGLPRVRHFSVSAEIVEVTSKITLSFNLE